MDIKAQRPNLLFTKLLFGLEPKSIYFYDLRQLWLGRHKRAFFFT